MLMTRVISALLGLPFLIFFIIKGDPYFFFLFFILTLLAFREFKMVIKNSQYQTLNVLFWGAALLFFLLFLLKYKYIKLLFIFYFLFSGTYYLLHYPQYSPLDLSFTLLGIGFILNGFLHLLLLRQLPGGIWLVFYLFLVVWGTDTGAYFSGMFWGKRQLAPLLSPQKTWEGFVGGLVVSLFLAYLFGQFVPLEIGGKLFYLAPFISLAGQLGDLFASSLKRFAEVKDMGKIIPGHGGILDRFDSTLWAAPTAFYLLIILERLLCK